MGNLEKLFLIYAFPSIRDCGRIDEKEVDELEKKIVMDLPLPPKEEIMEILPMAFKRMEENM